MQNDIFLGLSSVGWTAISSIATSIAVITALFFPLIDKIKRRKNIYSIIDHEIKRNIAVLNKALSLNENYLSFTNAPAAVKKGFIIQDISTNYWEENKQYISEHSSKKYNEYLEINNIFNETKAFAFQVLNTNEIDPPLQYIEVALERAYSLLNNQKKN